MSQREGRETRMFSIGCRCRKRKGQKRNRGDENVTYKGRISGDSGSSFSKAVSFRFSEGLVSRISVRKFGYYSA